MHTLPQGTPAGSICQSCHCHMAVQASHMHRLLIALLMFDLGEQEGTVATCLRISTMITTTKSLLSAANRFLTIAAE